jgi:hypothetical protein
MYTMNENENPIRQSKQSIDVIFPQAGPYKL